ncbi:hypothetical protein CLF_102279 [Clonorchis sinensis]|uniref:Uncharacterized protein n=1 Tax=Clonorchis sinensis TaxID=79923 RepID=G7Y7N5_CLOSI|nr:hypothetical protein CLF_102279 [Clonorchis sinensis]
MAIRLAVVGSVLSSKRMSQMYVETVKIEEETPRLVEDKQWVINKTKFRRNEGGMQSENECEENSTVKIRQENNHNQPPVNRALFTVIPIFQLSFYSALLTFKSDIQMSSSERHATTSYHLIRPGEIIFTILYISVNTIGRKREEAVLLPRVCPTNTDWFPVLNESDEAVDSLRRGNELQKRYQ